MASKATVIECEICFECYDDTVRIPKFLKCYHTYCLPCLKEVVSRGSIKCPACQEETSVSETQQIENLQTNFYLTISTAAAREKTNGEHLKSNTKNDCDQTGNSEELQVKKLINQTLTKDESKLKAGLAARREMAEKLEATLTSFQAFFQELHELKRKNWEKIKTMERSIEELGIKAQLNGFIEPGKKKDESLRSARTLLQKVTAESEEAISSYNLLTTINRIPFSINIHEDSAETEVTAKLFEKALDLGALPELASSRDRQSIIALSHLVLLNTELGKKWCTNLLTGVKVDSTKKENFEQPKRTVAEALNRSCAELLDNDRNTLPQRHQNLSDSSITAPTRKTADFHTAPVVGKRDAFTKAQNHESVATVNINKKNGLKVKLPNSPEAMKPRCFLQVHVNGQPFGRIEIELNPQLAPRMSQKFEQLCENTSGNTYHGTTFHKSGADAYIIGGRSFGPEDLFLADPSPLKRGRGAVFLRLKRDISKACCSVVASEFIIQLNSLKKDSTWTTTVFGYVRSGLQVCDRISRIDCSKGSVVIASAGIVG